MNADKTTPGTSTSTPMQPGAHSRALVTEEDLRRLLTADEPNARLVLEEGRIRLEGSTAEPEGMLVISRTDLLARIGDAPDPTALTEQATELDNEIRLMGA
ncbi:hypothetical protein [Nocardia paucivorans]|uniref:hypothetical protein n=1 Tax=Nocardia paucivorans TaxID=114259 RepID=UPI0012F8EC49|nr:hypothetical protein [Nocardia paucivorans]